MFIWDQKESITLTGHLINLLILINAHPIQSYALYLKSDFQEPFQCLFVTKCAQKRKEAGLPLSDDTVPQGDDSVFWEKSWKPELWIRQNHDSPDDAEIAQTNQEPSPSSTKTSQKEISDQERILRQNVRRQKFGKLAKLLAKRYPNDNLNSMFVLSLSILRVV